MITKCPTCGKDVDTLRARAVSVRDGKVVAFCSSECKAAQETKPVAVPVAANAAPAPVKQIDPAAPKTRIPLDENSSPVIEIVHEPASGVVTSAPDRRDSSASTHSDSASTSGSTTIPDAKDTKKKKKGKPEPLEKIDRNEKIEQVGKVETVETAEAKAKKASPKQFDAKAGSETPVAGFRLGEFTAYKPDDSKKPKVTASVDHDEAAPPAAKGGLKVGIVLLVVLVLGGGALIAYKLVLSKHSNAATRPGTPVPVVEPIAPDAAVAPPVEEPEVAGAKALEHATTFLRSQLTATPRIAVVAAAALARTKDKASLEVLATAMPKQDSDLGKIEVAYQLARGGDKRGLDTLVTYSHSENRDRRLEAGQALARLGDPRAITVLLDYLEYSQHRVSTAILLATLAEPKAVKVLDMIVADPAAIADDKARATIALATVAGRAGLQPTLVGFLGDSRQNTDAAAALARVHNEAARPVLINQLGVWSLRVPAARSLRVLEPGLDASANLVPLLTPLLAALDSTKDMEQLAAAEAILILAGPAAWSEHE